MTWTMDDAPVFAAALVRTHHTRFAEFAETSYLREGRGLVAVTFRGDPPDKVPEIHEFAYGYRPVAEYCEKIAPLTGPGRAMAEGVVRLVDCYDPASFMVVLVVVGPQFLTCPFIAPLRIPATPHESGWVH